MKAQPSLAVVIVGLGAVGKTLARALAATGRVELTLVGNGVPGERRWVARQGWWRKKEAQRVGRYTVSLLDLRDPIDIIILAVEDWNIGRVAKELSRLPLSWQQVSVLHTSGVQGSAVLKPVAAKGAGAAAWHPYQTFPARAQNTPLAGITFGITGNRRGQAAARRLTRLLGGKPLTIREQDRVLYHLSAVLACGFVAADVKAAMTVLKALGISEKRALEAVLPIAESTLANIRTLGIEAAQTGPAVRGDKTTIEKHRKALKKSDPEMEKMYAAVTEYVMKVKSR
jgi:predicted short-subunit dehydrogenase-like oxidoreductase (DUF2520 family)